MLVSVTTKFTFAAVGIVSVVLAGSAAVSLDRERTLFERDTANDAQILAATVAKPFLRLWQQEGEERALTFLAEAQGSAGGGQIQWIAEDTMQRPWAEAGAKLRTPFAATSFRDNLGNSGAFVTLMRVAAPAHPGFIGVRESLQFEDNYLRESLRNHLVTVAILVVLAGLGMWLVGRHFVGRPVGLLVGKARRAGEGDLGGPVLLNQRGELHTLAVAVNDMCNKLARSRQQLLTETEARIAAVDQLRHAERLATVGRLASGVAHELGTPLNVILGRASMISAENATEVVTHVRVIERQVARMAKIIRGLLDFSRNGSAQRTPTNAQSIVVETARMLKPLAEKSGVAIVVEDTQDNVALVGDNGQLQQVLINLVVNAIQAGHAHGHVRLRCLALPGGATDGPGGESILGPAVVIHVVDDGVGMPDDVRRRVFEPFFTTKDIGDGTGLGLSVSHGIVHDHGGFISVQSAVGSGSHFSVFLPCMNPVEETPSARFLPREAAIAPALSAV